MLNYTLIGEKVQIIRSSTNFSFFSVLFVCSGSGSGSGSTPKMSWIRNTAADRFIISCKHLRYCKYLNFEHGCCRWQVTSECTRWIWYCSYIGYLFIGGTFVLAKHADTGICSPYKKLIKNNCNSNSIVFYGNSGTVPACFIALCTDKKTATSTTLSFTVTLVYITVPACFIAFYTDNAKCNSSGIFFYGNSGISYQHVISHYLDYIMCLTCLVII